MSQLNIAIYLEKRKQFFSDKLTKCPRQLYLQIQHIFYKSARRCVMFDKMKQPSICNVPLTKPLEMISIYESNYIIASCLSYFYLSLKIKQYDSQCIYKHIEYIFSGNKLMIDDFNNICMFYFCLFFQSTHVKNEKKTSMC